MRKWWLGMALSAAWLSQAGAGQAQYLPGAPCPAPPEPVPYRLSEQGVPGPLDARNTPPVPPDMNSLPAHLPGAFDGEEYNPCRQLYMHFGSVGLQRQRLGRGTAAYTDIVGVPAGQVGQQIGGNAVVVVPGTGADTGFVQIPRLTRTVQDFDDISPDFNWGPKATIGFMWDNCVLELTGYALPQNSPSVTTTRPGALNTFFTNPPIGFVGNNGIGLQADLVRTSLETTLYNGEVNYRYFDKAVTGCQLIVGARYLDLSERLSMFVDDDGLTVRDFVNLRPDTARQFNYSLRSHNRLVLGQIGYEYQYQCNKWWAIGTMFKSGFGANFNEQDVRLRRGDGFQGPSQQRSSSNFAHLYDFQAFIDLYACEQMRFRFTWNCLWALNVAEAVDQKSFNLSNGFGPVNEQGSVFYHGPALELQFLF